MARLAEMERELVCERGIRTRLDAVSRIRKWICVVAPDALICRCGRAILPMCGSPLFRVMRVIDLASEYAVTSLFS